MSFEIKNNNITDFENTIHKEWALTNGIGGYAGGSVNGALSRTHHGYLIASYHPPVSRYLVFAKTNERLVVNETSYNLEASQHKGKKITDGNKYLKEFSYDKTVCFDYQVQNVSVKKHISLAPCENTVAIGYEINNPNDSEADLFITPLMNYREHSQSSTKESLDFEINKDKNSFTLTPAEDKKVKIFVGFSDGELLNRNEKYDIDTELQIECDNEVDGLDTHFTPYDIHIKIPAGVHRFSLVCHTCYDEEIKYKNIDAKTAFVIQKKQEDSIDKILENVNTNDPLIKNLTIASNQFLAYRQSTGYMTVLAGLPWFTDWGRDTMIAYTGLTLCTHRYKEAHDILLTFAQYVKNGMIPNMFPDDGQEPLYNTVDASLWYFYAVYKYLTYVDTKEAYDFIYKDIYPSLKEIINAYKNGTDFSIYMDDDYLIHAGSGLDQVTWMDVRVGDWVATPRHGKPVEINALWYNALKVMEFLAEKYGEDTLCYSSFAENVKTSFCNKFWNENLKCLYDVVEDNSCDDSLRPNQIYAVSLPFTMLSEEQNKAIVEIVQKKLYTGCGLRSLSPDHKDYHPIYLGSLDKRDHAYHQGTSWGFLLGGFITAYMKVNNYSKEAAINADKMLNPVREHLTQNCIGSICEIFDGDSPHNGRGCYAQAWSVGETLRCYTEDILPFM